MVITYLTSSAEYQTKKTVYIPWAFLSFAWLSFEQGLTPIFNFHGKWHEFS